MKENFEVIKDNKHIVLITHKIKPRLAAEISKPSNEVTYLKVFSNGYLTSEIDKVLTAMKDFVKHDNSH